MDAVDKVYDILEDLDNRLSGLEGRRPRTEDWMVVPFDFGIVPANPGPPLPPPGALATQMVSGDGPFDLVEITHLAINGVGVNNLFQMRIREGESTGRPLSRDGEFIEAASTSGTAQRPYVLKGRRRFRPNIPIVVEILNLSPIPNDIQIVFHGLKVFSR